MVRKGTFQSSNVSASVRSAEAVRHPPPRHRQAGCKRGWCHHPVVRGSRHPAGCAGDRTLPGGLHGTDAVCFLVSGVCAHGRFGHSCSRGRSTGVDCDDVEACRRPAELGPCTRDERAQAHVRDAVAPAMRWKLRPGMHQRCVSLQGPNSEVGIASAIAAYPRSPGCSQSPLDIWGCMRPGLPGSSSAG
jgi:hypothetical protein